MGFEEVPGVGLYPILHIPLQPALRYIMLQSDDCLKAMSGKYCRHLFSGLLGYINCAANLSFTLSPAIHKNGQQPRPPGRALSAAGRLPHSFAAIEGTGCIPDDTKLLFFSAHPLNSNVKNIRARIFFLFSFSLLFVFYRTYQPNSIAIQAFYLLAPENRRRAGAALSELQLHGHPALRNVPDAQPISPCVSTET